MTKATTSPTSFNLLLKRLSPQLRHTLLAMATPFSFAPGEVIADAGDPARYVLFPTRGYVSLVAQAPGQPDVEVGIVGREGIFGAHLALGVNITPLRTIGQGSGEVLGIPVRPFLPVLAGSEKLQSILQRFLFVQMTQLATSTACKHSHGITVRLARWLLMSQDRAQSNYLHSSHENLAMMLGVRRPGITEAAIELKSAGLIDYHRGAIRLLDRAGLQNASCSCYAADNAAYEAMFPPSPDVQAEQWPSTIGTAGPVA